MEVTVDVTVNDVRILPKQREVGVVVGYIEERNHGLTLEEAGRRVCAEQHLRPVGI